MRAVLFGQLYGGTTDGQYDPVWDAQWGAAVPPRERSTKDAASATRRRGSHHGRIVGAGPGRSRQRRGDLGCRSSASTQYSRVAPQVKNTPNGGILWYGWYWRGGRRCNPCSV